VQLSSNTTTRRCEGMAVDVEERLRKDIEAYQCLSLQFDELIDMVDVAQLCVFTSGYFLKTCAPTKS